MTRIQIFVLMLHLTQPAPHDIPVGGYSSAELCMQDLPQYNAQMEAKHPGAGYFATCSQAIQVLVMNAPK